MVDADQARQAPEVVSGPEDLALVDAPPRERRLKRSSTAPKKQEGGGLMGLFGSLRKNTRPDMPDRRKSRSYRDEDAKGLTEPEREDARRARRDERRRRSVRPDTDGEELTTDAAGAAPGGEAEVEDPEARRAARRARRSSRQAPSDTREMEAREAEERRARRKEKERAREAREQRAREEEEEHRREEKRARRAAREERRAREEQAAREAEVAAEAKAAERRERRRMREEGTAAKAKRRRSRVEEPPPEVYPDEADVEGRRGSRTAEDPFARRRKSRAVPAQERTRAPLMSGGINHSNTGGNKKDKISSWVYSQADEPPEPPPIMPTVIDMPPAAAAAAADAANAHSLSSDEEARRAVRRRARRRAKYPDMPDEEIDDLRSRRRDGRRDGVKSSSGSGDYERDRGMRSHGSRHGVPAPPSSGAKKSSWFRKLTNL